MKQNSTIDWACYTISMLFVILNAHHGKITRNSMKRPCTVDERALKTRRIKQQWPNDTVNGICFSSLNLESIWIAATCMALPEWLINLDFGVQLSCHSDEPSDIQI